MSKLKTQVLTYKLPINKIVSTDWRIFNSVAGDISHLAIQLMNDAIDMHYLHQKEKFHYKKEHGVSLNVKERYGTSTYQTIINRTLKDRYSEMLDIMPADLFERIIREATQIFQTNAGDILKGNAKLNTFRRDQPIPVRARNVKPDENGVIRLPLMSSKKAEELGFTGQTKGIFTVQLNLKGKNKEVYDKVVSGEYKLSDSKLQRSLRGNKWFFLMTVTQPIKDTPDLAEDTVLGVDLGISKVAYMALNNSKQNFFIDGGELRNFRNKTRARRKSMQNQLRVCSHNRRGRGKKTLLKPLEALREKEANFNDLANHRYSKAIIEYAVKNGAGTIQIEDLSSIKDKRKENSLLGDWTYFDLATKIEYKAKEKGIKVIKIDPSYTSQRCNNCGVIDKESRKSQEVFHCTSCDHKTNADLNASRNIAMPDIEHIIQVQLKAQKEAEKGVKQ